MSDPFDALRLPLGPRHPDPQFAAQLRDRLVRALLGPSLQEPPMTPDLQTDLPRNGLRHGDVGYITIGLPDIERGRAFYGAVLGWTFSPGSSKDGAQVDRVIPMIGLWGGPLIGGRRTDGAVLGYRVDDISRAIARVREAGGVSTEPRREPYGLTADATDDQGMPFYLFGEMEEPAEQALDLSNGVRSGDVSYISMVAASSERARAFYGTVLGDLDRVTPQVGLADAGSKPAAVILSYRVDDIAATVAKVRDAGGTATDPVQRPYALEADCADDQGIPFYLHQFAGQDR